MVVSLGGFPAGWLSFREQRGLMTTEAGSEHMLEWAWGWGLVAGWWVFTYFLFECMRMGTADRSRSSLAGEEVAWGAFEGGIEEIASGIGSGWWFGARWRTVTFWINIHCRRRWAYLNLTSSHGGNQARGPTEVFILRRHRLLELRLQLPNEMKWFNLNSVCIEDLPCKCPGKHWTSQQQPPQKTRTK